MNSSVGGRNNIWSASNHNLVFIDADTIPRIVYSTSSFREDDVNNGSINSTISIELIDLNFVTSGALTLGVDFITENIPVGTEIFVNVIDATHAEITMTGQVENHTESDGFSNLEIHFTENPFLRLITKIYTTHPKRILVWSLWILMKSYILMKLKIFITFMKVKIGNGLEWRLVMLNLDCGLMD